MADPSLPGVEEQCVKADGGPKEGQSDLSQESSSLVDLVSERGTRECNGATVSEPQGKFALSKCGSCWSRFCHVCVDGTHAFLVNQYVPL